MFGKSRIAMRTLLVIVFVALSTGNSIAGSVPGQAVVSVAVGTDVRQLANDFSVGIIDSIPNRQVYLLRFSDTLNANNVVQSLDADSRVDGASLNVLYALPRGGQVSIGFPDNGLSVFAAQATPSKFYEQQTTLRVGLDSAHLFSTGAGVTVAVIDNGLDLSHPLFGTVTVCPAPNFLALADASASDSGAMYGHGTLLGGLILLAAPNCALMPLTAFDGNGIGNEFAIARAIYWAIDHKARVVNMSFSAPFVTALLQQAIKDAAIAGLLLVAAVGNDASQALQYPAAYPGVIAVSAIDSTESIASFSNSGPFVDLCAPGVNLYSSWAGPYRWGTCTGTSFSTALVSGAAALVLAARPDLSAPGASDDLLRSARPKLKWGTIRAISPLYGYGALDAFCAVHSVRRGDLDNSGRLDVLDLVALQNIVFTQNAEQSAGAANNEISAKVRILADVNCDGRVDEADVAMMTTILYQNVLLSIPCR